MIIQIHIWEKHINLDLINTNNLLITVVNFFCYYMYRPPHHTTLNAHY